MSPHPTTGAASTAAVQQRRATARSVATRLLEGAGRCTVVAYRVDPHGVHRPLAHGLAGTGQIALALDAGFEVEPGRCAAVRLRIDQLGADPRIRVATASLHALAHLRVPDEQQLAALTEGGALPEEVALAVSGGARLALLATDKLLVHGHGGVSTLALHDLDEHRGFPAAAQEWDCTEVLAGTGMDRHAASVVQEVTDGARAGVVCAAQPTPASVARHAGETVLADVDSTGCTWLVIEEHLTRSVFVPFASPVHGLDDLAAAVRELRTTTAGDRA